MATCNRCGACCHFKADGKVRACKNLIKLGKGLFHCRIYNQKDRVGSVIYKAKDGRVFKCLMVEEVGLNWRGCPYNKPENLDAPEDLQPPF